MPIRASFLAALCPALLLIAGCSGSGGEAPVPTAAPVVDPAPKAPSAKVGQPGTPDYSGKGVGSGEGR